MCWLDRKTQIDEFESRSGRLVGNVVTLTLHFS